MTRRGLLLGLFLGLFIASFTYYNDQVVQNTFLIGNFLPVGVFGVVLILLLLVNPLLICIRESWGLKSGEFAVITALGLAACAWPSSNLYRVSTGILTMPGHHVNFQTTWQSNHLMAYVPGVSDELAQGHIRDWNRFAEMVAEADAAGNPPAARLQTLLTDQEQGVFSRAAASTTVSVNEMMQMTRALNRLLGLAELYDPEAFAGVELPAGLEEALAAAPDGVEEEVERVRLNRILMVAAFPELVLPPPRGMPVLVDARGREDKVLTPLLEGRPDDQRLSLRELPWSIWGPTARLWTLVVLSLGVATVSLSLVVHHQWSKNELLSYPVARFLEETLHRDPHRRLPNILHQKIFWLGFVFVAVFHLYNGIATWFPAIPIFPEHIDAGPLMTLFPNARQVPGAWALFRAYVYFSVIAFAFFLDSRISLSLGVSTLFWVMFGSVLIANGVQIGASYMGAENSNLIRMGAYAGFAIMILYTGRRYYREAALATFGFGGKSSIPPYVARAGRGLAASSVLAVYACHLTGMNLFWAVGITLAVLLIFLVMGRVVAETGAFFIQPQWLPVGVFTALFGFEMIGPTQYVVMAIASTLLVGDPRETLMPYILNGLKLGENATNNESRRQSRLGLVLLGMVILSFFVAGAVTLYTQYNEGVSSDQWANRSLPSMPFQSLDRNISELSGRGNLSEVVADTTGRTPLRPSPEPHAVSWALVGLVLVLLFGIARLRLTWWPFHPVVFLVWGTFPLTRFAPSFFIGWLIKEAVMKTSGAKGFRTCKPMMVGIIAAEVLAAIGWGIVSLVYYRVTGLPPTTYRIYPG